MPRGDGTGPMGAGPMTGRGAGYCAGYNTPGFMTGGGLGRGMGRGFRNHWFSRWNTFHTPPVPPAGAPTKTDQISALKAQMQSIQQQIESLESS